MKNVLIEISQLSGIEIDDLVKEINSEISTIANADKIDSPVDSLNAVDICYEIIVQLLDTQAAAQLVESIITMLSAYLVAGKIKRAKIDGKNIKEIESTDKRKIENKLKD